MAQEPAAGEKVVIIKSVLDWLLSITLKQAAIITLLAVAGSAVVTAIKIQDPQWKATNLFPRSVSREKVPGGCILQTFHMDNEPDVVLIYRFAARGTAIFNLGYEADWLKANPNGGSESACAILKGVAERLEQSSDIPK